MNKMMNIKKHYIYNDNFTLNVLDLNQIHLATKEDKAYKIDHWAKLFKAKTGEDLYMLAQNDNVFEETCETVYKLNQNNEVRYLCEMREEGQRIMRTYQNMIRRRDAALADNAATIAEKEATIAELQAQIKALQNQIDMQNNHN